MTARTRTALGGVLVLIGGLLLAAGQALMPQNRRSAR